MATTRQINYLKRTKYAAEELKKETAAKKEAIQLSKQARLSDFSMDKLESLLKEHQLHIRRRREFEAAKVVSEPSRRKEMERLKLQKGMLHQKYSVDKIKSQIEEISSRRSTNASLSRRTYVELQNHVPTLFVSLRDTVKLNTGTYLRSGLPVHTVWQEAVKIVDECDREMQKLWLIRDQLIAQLESELTPINKEIQSLEAALAGRFEEPEFVLSQGKLKKKFQNLSIWPKEEQELVIQEIQKKREALHKMENLRAVAAAHVGKQREEADKIKSGLKKQLHTHKECPYCWEILNPDDAHADHIYPIAKGGLSTTRNMVYVCSKCNSRKGALTLREFTLKHKLDREAIEMVLEELDKSF